jgi:hypothetical protein
MKYWELIADNLKKRGWSWGCVSAIDSTGRAIRIADGHRGDGKHYVVSGDELLTSFLELEKVTRDAANSRRNRDTRISGRFSLVVIC